MEEIVELSEQDVRKIANLIKPLSKGEGLRYNKGKARYDLVQPWAHEQMVKVLTTGAQKYAERNWERGMKWSNVISSLKRHVAAIESGEDYDQETGLLHAAHVACNAHFLTAYYKIYPQGDDRPHSYLENLRIGLDVDDVIADFLGEWCKREEVDTPTSWQFDRSFIQKMDEMTEDGSLAELYSKLKPKIDPNELPFEPVVYITARSVPNEVTERWLDRMGFPTAPVITVGPGNSKLQAALDYKLDIFVDDNYKTFIELNKAGIMCYLYDMLHNRRYNVGHKRLKDLRDLCI